MLIKTRAVVLHHIKYSESSILLYCYTEQYGRMSCIVNRIKTKNTKVPGHLFQPLTILNMEVYYKVNRGIQRVKELSCLLTYSTIPYQTGKSCIAIFVAEVLYKTLHEEESNPVLFNFLLNMLQVFDMNTENTANFHLMFMLHYSRFLGFFPAGLLNDHKQADSSDLQIFLTLPDDAMHSVKQMLQWPDVQLEKIRLNNRTRTLILDRLIQFYSMHMEGTFKIKSIPVLKEVFR
ncbi:MAG: DNA repair protein RecO [Bacteroidales bacterium]|nr:DNA repair protein RecO [Bacteroidales bacterium]